MSVIQKCVLAQDEQALKTATQAVIDFFDTQIEEVPESNLFAVMQLNTAKDTIKMSRHKFELCRELMPNADKRWEKIMDSTVIKNHVKLKPTQIENDNPQQPEQTKLSGDNQTNIIQTMKR